VDAPARILVPAEPRRGNAGAVAYAAALATALDAELLLLGLVALRALGPLTVPPEPDGIAAFEAPDDPVVRRQLARTEARLGPAAHARPVLGWGPAGPAIVDAAREEAADLVVVPLHGSTARHVANHCDVPILVVPARDTAPSRTPDVDPVLAAIDGSGATGDDVPVIPWPHRGALGHLLHDHAAWQALEHGPLPALVVPAGER
jgi:nucleotide-binding universal stress UspA family protein